MRRARRMQARADKKYSALRQCLDFDWVFSWEHLVQSMMICKSGVMWKDSVNQFTANGAARCEQLRLELSDGSYEKRGNYRFVINERGKQRNISGVRFRDRVVQRALCEWSLVPVVSRSLIDSNAASRVGKGTQYSRRRFLEDCKHAVRCYDDPWVVLFDYHDYFNSIDSARACQMIADEYRSIARTGEEKASLEDRLLPLLRQFVCDEDGLGLGNQTSQTIAIWYCDAIDHKMQGYGRYGRYMDDAYLVAGDRQTAVDAMGDYEKMSASLGLTLNKRKTQLVRLIGSDVCWLKRIVRFDELPLGVGDEHGRMGSRSVIDGAVEPLSMTARMDHRALKWGKRHVRNVIRKYDGANINDEVLRSIACGFDANSADVTSRRGLRRLHHRWMQKHRSTISVDFA